MNTATLWVILATCIATLGSIGIVLLVVKFAWYSPVLKIVEKRNNYLDEKDRVATISKSQTLDNEEKIDSLKLQLKKQNEEIFAETTKVTNQKSKEINDFHHDDFTSKMKDIRNEIISTSLAQKDNVLKNIDQLSKDMTEKIIKGATNAN